MLSGTLSQLVTYTGFAVVLFSAIAVSRAVRAAPPRRAARRAPFSAHRLSVGAGDLRRRQRGDGGQRVLAQSRAVAGRRRADRRGRPGVLRDPRATAERGVNSATPPIRNSQPTPNSQRSRISQEQVPVRLASLRVLGVGCWALIGRCGVVELRSCASGSRSATSVSTASTPSLAANSRNDAGEWRARSSRAGRRRRRRPSAPAHHPQIPARAVRIAIRPVVADADGEQEEPVEIGEDRRLRRRDAEERREPIRREQQKEPDARVVDARDRGDRPYKRRAPTMSPTAPLHFSRNLGLHAYWIRFMSPWNVTVCSGVISTSNSAVSKPSALSSTLWRPAFSASFWNAPSNSSTVPTK